MACTEPPKQAPPAAACPMTSLFVATSSPPSPGHHYCWHQFQLSSLLSDFFSLNRLYSISDVRSGARRWERVGVSLAGCPRWLPMALLRRTSVVQVYRHRAARGLLLGLIACNFHAGLPGPSSQLPQNVGRPRHCCTVSHTRLRGGANTAGGGDGLAGAFRCRPAHMLPRVLVSTIPCVSDIHTLSS